jgi:aminoglycoside phosphotransferase (APT) family kinase protein
MSASNHLDIDVLNVHFEQFAPEFGKISTAQRFKGGYSNLTYLLSNTDGAGWVLRMPPHGANIQTAHDMQREYKVLTLLRPHYPKVPEPLYFCADKAVLGQSFYVMSKIVGQIFRATDADNLAFDASTWRKMAMRLVENLVQLHALDLEKTGLIALGKPEGYVERQVNGWIKRYHAAQTEDIAAMQEIENWLTAHLPKAQSPTFLHNDYKYDNVLFDFVDDEPNIVGVLDWEMSTVGDPLMDLGAMLAYWVEKNDPLHNRAYNLSWLDGNLTRPEVIAYYAQLSGRDVSDISFYYIFGLYKNAVIAQQIYARWQAGYSTDARFGQLIHFVKSLGQQAYQVIMNYEL